MARRALVRVSGVASSRLRRLATTALTAIIVVAVGGAGVNLAMSLRLKSMRVQERARAEKIAKFLLDGPEEKLNKSTSFEESLTEYAEYAKSSDPLIQWARDELRKIDEGPFTTIGYLRILEIISDMNHSGASLPRFLNVLCYLAQKHRLDPNHQIGV